MINPRYSNSFVTEGEKNPGGKEHRSATELLAEFRQTLMKNMATHDSNPVSAADLEHLLSEVKRSAARATEGLFGPDSVSWKINREAGLFLAAGRATLLQLAHPWVAAAIAEHSRTLHDPIGRFHQTFRVMFTATPHPRSPCRT